MLDRKRYKEIKTVCYQGDGDWGIVTIYIKGKEGTLEAKEMYEMSFEAYKLLMKELEELRLNEIEEEENAKGKASNL